MTRDRICISIARQTCREVLEAAAVCSDAADLLEIRFDALRDARYQDLADELIRRGSAERCIATFRHVDEGGLSIENDEVRRQFFSKYASFFWAVDVGPEMLPAVSGARRKIVSYHQFRSGPIDVDRKFCELASPGADIVKIAVHVDDAADALPLWGLLRDNRETGVVPIAMGEAGVWTRILGCSHGAALTYAASGPDDRTAPGQPTATELREIYGSDRLGPDTKVYGVIGDPVSASLSPVIHNAAFTAAGIDSVFIPFRVRSIAAFVKEFIRSKRTGIRVGGFAVTMPHKVAIMDHLDEVMPEASLIGAVNTVTIDASGRSIGKNTDAGGFFSTFAAEFGPAAGMRVAIVGSGGAARACAYALTESGAEVTIVSRSRAAGPWPGETSVADADSINFGRFDAVVNATPIGMEHVPDDKMYFSPERLQGVKYVYDLVVTAVDTPLVRAAAVIGAKSVGGLAMLVEQAALQFEDWTGEPADRELMAKAAAEALTRR